MSKLARLGPSILLALLGQLACSSAAPPSPGPGGTETSAGGGVAAATSQSGSAPGGSEGSSGGALGGGAGGGVAPSGGSGAGVGGIGGIGGTGIGGTGLGGGGSAGCSGKPYKLCEGFEDGQVGSLPSGWTELAGYGPGSPTDVVLATDEFHGGKMSLKSSSNMRGATRARRDLSALGATAYEHWGRVFYKVDDPAPRPNGGVLHVTFVSLDGPGGENRIVDVVQNTGGAHQWLFNVPNDSCCAGSDYDWRFDAEWHCAEWYVDATARSYRFFHDSEPVEDISFTNRSNAPMSEYDAIVVGETYYQPSSIISSPFTVWFDDLAIHDERIGCE